MICCRVVAGVQPVGAEDDPNQTGIGRPGEEPGLVGGTILLEQPLELVGQLRLGRPEAVEPRPLLRPGQVERLVQQRLQGRPAVAFEQDLGSVGGISLC